MKKILVVLLILGISAGAFAQLKAELSADINPELFKYTTLTGDSSRAEYGGSDGNFDLLSSSNLRKNNEVRLALTYTGENYGGYIRWRLDPLFVPGSGSQNNSGFGTQGGNFFNNNGQGVTVQNLFDQNFNTWRMYGNWDASFAKFTAWIGNSDDRGKTSGRVGTFDDFLKIKQDSYGIIAPIVTADVAGLGNTLGYLRLRETSSGTATVPGTMAGSNTYKEGSLGGAFNVFETNNLLKAPNNGRVNTTLTDTAQRTAAATQFGTSDQPFYVLSMNMSPFTVQLAGDVGNNSGIVGGNDHTRFNGGLRFSGDRVGDFVSFDITYRFRGGDTNTRSDNTIDVIAGTAPQPDGGGNSAHSFGLFAHLFLIKDLVIGLGYSGVVRSYEDDYVGTDNYLTSWSSPYINGIDLRAQFTGVDKLNILFHNNISFAFGKESDEENHRLVYGFDGTTLANNVKEGWFAMYNALGADYMLSEYLKVAFQISNRIGMYSIEHSIASDNRRRDIFVEQFSATAFASYQFSSHLTVATGLSFYMDSVTDTPNVVLRDPAMGNNDKTFSSGSFTIGVPVRLLITY